MSFPFAADTYDALLVDDEPTLRQAMARAFNGSGFRCDLAANGRQALEMLANRRYHVVVTDLSMPELNGHQLAVELLKQADRPVVMVVTGCTEPKLERDLRARGVDEILFKPVDYSLLAAQAKALIEARATRPHVQVSRAGMSVAERPEATSAIPVSGDNVPTRTVSRSAGASPAAGNVPVAIPSLNSANADDSPAAKEILKSMNAAAHLANQRIERLEKELSTNSRSRVVAWPWQVLIFAIGASFGWLLAFLAR